MKLELYRSNQTFLQVEQTSKKFFMSNICFIDSKNQCRNA